VALPFCVGRLVRPILWGCEHTRFKKGTGTLPDQNDNVI
jgi:hypothetical protein